MEYATIVLSAIQLVKDLIDRGKQTGELTDQQSADLEARAASIFSRYGSAAPPPKP